MKSRHASGVLVVNIYSMIPRVLNTDHRGDLLKLTLDCVLDHLIAKSNLLFPPGLPNNLIDSGRQHAVFRTRGSWLLEWLHEWGWQLLTHVGANDRSKLIMECIEGGLFREIKFLAFEDHTFRENLCVEGLSMDWPQRCIFLDKHLEIWSWA